QPKGIGVLAPRLNPPHAAKALPKNSMIPDRLLGSWVVFACVIKAIVSVIKVWSSLHVHSGIRQMCVVFDSDAVLFQCTLVCRESDIPEARQWRFTDRRKFCLILYAISLASAWVVTRTP
ncbi:hypothetical protein, partial [Bradyrhizobium sp. 141]|uniref:hypothetical protein n=1 Tax=Bradyrhizobium sp. 141 TaxID=2782617 RepID=UPI001FF6FE88